MAEPPFPNGVLTYGVFLDLMGVPRQGLPRGSVIRGSES